MKNIISILISILFINNIFSQIVENNLFDMNTQLFDANFYARKGGSYYLSDGSVIRISIKNKTCYFKKLDSKLQLIGSEHKVEFASNAQTNQRRYVFGKWVRNDKIDLLTKIKNLETKQFDVYVQSYSTDDFSIEIEPMKIFSYTEEWDVLSKFKTTISENGKYILFQNTVRSEKKGKRLLSFKMFDDEYNLIWASELKDIYTNKSQYFPKCKVSDKGYTAIPLEINLTEGSTITELKSIIIINDKGETIAQDNIVEDEYSFNKFRVNFIDENYLHIITAYSINDNYRQGYMSYYYDVENENFSEKVLNKMPIDVISENLSDKEKKKILKFIEKGKGIKELEQYIFQNIVVNSTGTYIFIEKHPKEGVFGSSIVLKFDMDNKIVWGRNIPKYQKSPKDIILGYSNDDFSRARNFTINNELYIFYNDNIKNLGKSDDIKKGKMISISDSGKDKTTSLFVAKITAEGEVTKTQLYNVGVYGGPSVRVKTGDLINKETIIFYTKGKNENPLLILKTK